MYGFPLSYPSSFPSHHLGSLLFPLLIGHILLSHLQQPTFNTRLNENPDITTEASYYLHCLTVHHLHFPLPPHQLTNDVWDTLSCLVLAATWQEIINYCLRIKWSRGCFCLFVFHFIKNSRLTALLWSEELVKARGRPMLAINWASSSNNSSSSLSSSAHVKEPLVHHRTLQPNLLLSFHSECYISTPDTKIN